VVVVLVVVEAAPGEGGAYLGRGLGFQPGVHISLHDVTLAGPGR